MENLRIALLQSTLYWEDVDSNLNCFEDKFKNLKNNVDLVVMPEMFASGFTMNAKTEVAKRYNDILSWMLSSAQEGDFVLIGSTIFCENDKFFNRLLVAHPDGEIQHYDKRHLFTMGAENSHFTAGRETILINLNGWRIRPFVCYDLRFPVWCRNTNNYDLAVFCANWPASRREAWKTLLKARAIENQAYVIGVNCVGEDGNNLKYSGDSVVNNYLGEEEMTVEPYKDGVFVQEISYKALHEFRKSFPVLNDMDNFEIIN